jgi:predicted SAM-dependent methyltransferase
MISVDIDPAQPEERPARTWWHIVYGDTRDYSTREKVEEMCAFMKRVPDIIYIDTDHTYEHMQRELEVWSPLADAHTVWLFHDTWMFGPYNHMTDAIKEYAAAHALTFFDLTHESHGLGMIKKFVGINAGSGQRPFDASLGWINLDIQPKVHDYGQDWEPMIVADMFNMPFPDGYADMVVSHHTIEHLGCGEANGFISEAYRVLRPGGSLLIFIPNARALAQRWLTNQITDYIYFVNTYGAYQGSVHDRHFWNYSLDSLKELCYTNNNWSKFKLFDWRDVAGASLAKDWWVLSVECVK